MACAWGWPRIPIINVINMMWSYGGKLVEADNKTSRQCTGHGAGREADCGVEVLARATRRPGGKPAIHDTTVTEPLPHGPLMDRSGRRSSPV